MVKKTRRTWDSFLITLLVAVALVSLPACFIFEPDDDDDNSGADTFSGDTGSNTNNNNTNNTNTNTSNGMDGLWSREDVITTEYVEIVDGRFFGDAGYQPPSGSLTEKCDYAYYGEPSIVDGTVSVSGSVTELELVDDSTLRVKFPDRDWLTYQRTNTWSDLCPCARNQAMTDPEFGADPNDSDYPDIGTCSN